MRNRNTTESKTATRISDHEIIVAGGGISGAAVAYGLMTRGHKVTLIDAPTKTNKASRTNCGLIWCQSKFLHIPEYARWAFHSCRIYPELTKELEEITSTKIPVNYTGGLIPCLGEDEFERRKEYIEGLRNALGEYPGSMISRIELEKKLPKISFGPNVTGAAWCEDDGVVEPLILLRAFKAAFLKLGGILLNSVIHDIQPNKNEFLIMTDTGQFRCARLVLTTGLANRRFARFAVSNLPINPNKGQVLLVERMEPVMPIPMLGLTQTFGGTIVIGFRHEAIGHDMKVIPEAVSSEGRWALNVWPDLGRKRLIRSWSGLRIMPEDKQAIYSRLPGYPNATIINTHSAVTLAAAHAKHLPEYILGGELPEMARGMTLQRFGIN